MNLLKAFHTKGNYYSIIAIMLSAILFLGITLWDDSAEACAIESALSCPETAEIGQPINCTLFIETESSTVPAIDYTAPIIYTWGDTGEAEITNAILTGSNWNAVTYRMEYSYAVTVRMLGPGTAVINAHGYIPGDPSYQTQDHQATLTVPEYTATVDLTCPPSLYITQPGACTTLVNTVAPIDSYVWSSSGSVTPDNENADVSFSSLGQGIVTVNVNIDRAPELTIDPPMVIVDNAVVDVIAPEITAALNCPLSLHIGEIGNCSVSATTTYGTLEYAWDSTGSVTGNGAFAEVFFDDIGQGTVTVTAQLAGSPDISVTKTAVVDVRIPDITDLQVNCPSSLYPGESGNCNAAATSEYGTVQYIWGGSGEITGSGDTATVQFNTIGQGTVTVRASLVEFPSVATERTVQVTVEDPQVNVSLLCPQTLAITQPGDCTLTGSSQWGTLQYTWASSGNISDNGDTATVTFNKGPQGTVTATASLVEAPNVTASATATISVEAPQVTASLSCPASLWITEQGDCTVDATATWGTLQYEWTSSGNVTDNENTAAVSFSTAATGTVSVRVSLVEFPEVSQTLSANVEINVPQITSEINCPNELWKNETGTCTVTASTTWGTLQYTWDSTGAVTDNGSSADVFFSDKGYGVINSTVNLAGAPAVSTTSTASILVNGYVTPVVTIDGPMFAYKKETHTYTINDIYSPSGQVDVMWFVDGVQYGAGNAITYTFAEAKRMEVKVMAAVQGSGNDPDGQGETSMGVYVSEYPKPIVYIKKPRTIFVNEPAEFTVNTYVPSGVDRQLFGRWVLPDGSYESGDALTYTFTTTGRQAMSYEAWFEGYEEDIVTRATNVYPMEYIFPDFSIGTYRGTEGVVPFLTYFRPSGDLRKTAGKTITYNWDFGDGTTYTSNRATYVYKEYDNPGVYTITLDVADEDGNTDSDSVQLTLNEPDPIELIIKPSYSNAYMRAPLNMYTRVYKTGGHPRDRIQSYDWKVNGESASDRSLFYYTMADPGTYNLSLDIKTMYDDAASASETVTVNANQAPVCDFTWQDYPKSKVTYFSPQCSDPDGRIRMYHWSLGDGTETTSPRAYGKYQNGGTYTVTLTAYDDSNEPGTVTKTVTVQR